MVLFNKIQKPDTSQGCCLNVLQCTEQPYHKEFPSPSVSTTNLSKEN